MSTFKEFLDEQLKDPEFRKEWDDLQPEMAIVQEIINVRKEKGLTQSDLAKLTGIAQSDISKFETGAGNPSLKTLRRLAHGLGKKVRLEFVDE